MHIGSAFLNFLYACCSPLSAASTGARLGSAHGVNLVDAGAMLGAAEAQRGGLRADVETISGAIASGRIPSTKVPHRGSKGQAHGGDPVYSSWEIGEASGGPDQLLVIDMTKPTPV